MKTAERHHLKHNELASTTALVIETVATNRDRIMMGFGIMAVVAVVGGGYWFWTTSQRNSAGALLGIALATEQSAITPPPTVPGASQTPGTFPTEQARLDASLKAFQQVIDQYGSTDAGLTAQYHAAITLLALGRSADADKAFQTVIDRGGSSIYVPMSKLGRAEVLSQSGKFDDAIKSLTDLSGDRDGQVPVDGVLMQLARTYLKAGKRQDARATFKRVVDEFPESPFAADARAQMALLG